MKSSDFGVNINEDIKNLREALGQSSSLPVIVVPELNQHVCLRFYFVPCLDDFLHFTNSRVYAEV